MNCKTCGHEMEKKTIVNYPEEGESGIIKWTFLQCVNPLCDDPQDFTVEDETDYLNKPAKK